ncbi:MAG: glycosyltransferase family 10 [Patescibacteria group bacterium]
MINIKVTNPYIPNNLNRQIPHQGIIWSNCKFFINQDIEKCDYWIVLNNVIKEEKVNCPSGNTILFALEPSSIQKYKPAFLNQFSKVVTGQKNIKHKDITRTLTTLFWHFNKTYDDLADTHFVKKTKLISIITSDKAFTSGHKRRLRFAYRLKEYFGDSIDLFGRGIRPFEDKWEVLAPYKFTVAIENEWQSDWITEKLTDCFLTYTFPLYYGCPNAEEYFHPDSFTRIDINNFDQSIKIIENILANEQYYYDHLNVLKKSREQTLNKYNFFPLVANKIISLNSTDKTKKEITILPEELFTDNLHQLKKIIGILNKFKK